MISAPHDSPFILVLCVPRSSRNSDGVTPCGGAKYRWGIKIARFSTNKLLYLANDTRYRHGCYGRRILETTPKLLNGISFNDLERPLSQFSRSRYYSMSNNSRTDRKLSNRAFFNDLEGPHTQITRSGYSWTLNIPKMAADTAIVTMEGE